MTTTKYSVIQEGTVYIDYGPITMTLEARREGYPFTEAAVTGAERVLEVFNDFTVYLDFLRKPVGAIASVPDNAPQTVRKMTESVMLLGEGDFTSLAAVAGTTSDFAVEAMAACGADYALANNGGDIAWYISMKQKSFLNVGLISDVSSGRTTHSLKIKSFGEIRGLATSGLGGRSLTRGIASAVTALAANSSMADAAATAIANACYCDDPAIEQCKAVELDYGTDIPELYVTKSVGILPDKSALIAASAGVERAEQLIDKGIICGAVIFVANEMRIAVSKNGMELFEVTKLDSCH
ncbi:hypothetical protein [Cloacibacillus evryensis]|uniref:hypothetical protein n=1 Tax=Cloacibacillus evryensis TaxID=508460 RepID=UPI002672B87F|nr:hypothetical protein [Cloacibacillus evryensis]